MSVACDLTALNAPTDDDSLPSTENMPPTRSHHIHWSVRRSIFLQHRSRRRRVSRSSPLLLEDIPPLVHRSSLLGKGCRLGAEKLRMKHQEWQLQSSLLPSATLCSLTSCRRTCNGTAWASRSLRSHSSPQVHSLSICLIERRAVEFSRVSAEGNRLVAGGN